MKHLLLVFLALVLSFTTASALDFYRAGKSAGELTVSYVAATDSSTMLLCKWTAPADGGEGSFAQNCREEGVHSDRGC